ncbi:uncharacterized protein [Lolium perenne]|uniref:uncharacterized protein n=1 Tax=Lolium perenne TaxID=4522 RepID=UPI0021F65266|nr:uncharacterized protein LOC127307421 [Lolium perenne]XP_051194109.1 uncharacterized protein LOC127307421 [Lolium perenne]XP_051194110.1 uncharacterized protein LOC127307421 [Lolium perenne]XP_051205112.1 uncharacterized protein LOC127318680 [Lolium perenne]
MEAMQTNTVDIVDRMKEIAQVMKTPDDVPHYHGVPPTAGHGGACNVPKPRAWNSVDQRKWTCVEQLYCKTKYICLVETTMAVILVTFRPCNISRPVNSEALTRQIWLLEKS